MSSFRLLGLDPEPFEPLFRLRDDELKARHIRRHVATSTPGFPCRVSLEDAAIGDELLLLPYAHLDVASPYRASGPIFIRRGARRRLLDADEIPPCISDRLISVRAYDGDGLMQAANVRAGRDVAAEIRTLFDDPSIEFIHLHNAKPGCFSCRVERA